MGDNVIKLGITTYADLQADTVLEKAHGFVSTAVVLGWDNAGEFYFASSAGEAKEILFLLELARAAVLKEIG